MLVTHLEKGRQPDGARAPTWSGDIERNRIHTGCLSVLADTACGIAVGTALDKLEPFATLDLRMDYLRSADASKNLICDAHCYRLSRSVAFVRGELRQPGNDEIIAVANATFMRATANSRRKDLDGSAPTLAQTSLRWHPAHSRRVDGGDCGSGQIKPTRHPRGRSPYVDFLG